MLWLVAVLPVDDDKDLEQLISRQLPGVFCEFLANPNLLVASQSYLI